MKLISPLPSPKAAFPRSHSLFHSFWASVWVIPPIRRRDATPGPGSLPLHLWKRLDPRKNRRSLPASRSELAFVWCPCTARAVIRAIMSSRSPLPAVAGLPGRSRGIKEGNRCFHRSPHLGSHTSLRDQEIPHEAHLPTEHSQASDEARVSCQKGNAWWPCGAPLPPAQGPSQAECVTASVTRRSTFAALSRSGARARHGVVRLRHLAVDHPEMQPGTPVALSFAFPRRFGSAVDRNRAKRRLRAAFLDADGPEHRGSILMSGTRGVLDCSYDLLVGDVRGCLDLVDPRAVDAGRPSRTRVRA